MACVVVGLLCVGVAAFVSGGSAAAAPNPILGTNCKVLGGKGEKGTEGGKGN